MQHNDNSSEEVFARLCSDKYFGGFVYQNPKFTLDTECEAGDVVLLVRDSLIIFEVIWRNPKYGSNTKSFVKDIGKKRDQLLGDFTTYQNPSLLISMESEHGEHTWYDHDQFNDKKTKGVVIVDAHGPIEKLHYDTVRLTAEAPLPIAVMTRHDFEALLVEADTVSDLGLYLGDRHDFLRTVFNEDPTPFLTLGANLEQELVGLYKLGDNSFDVGAWKTSKEKTFWQRYQIQRAAEINRRDEENAASESLDYMMAEIRSRNSADSPTNQHAWEIALLTRRERAALVSVISRKHDRLLDSHKDQKFAFQNHHTGCWDVYYLHHGLDSQFFRQEAQNMANRKLWIERSLNSFQYSVFCFAMRYTALGLREVVLTVSDAHKWPFITPEQLLEAQKFFGGTTHQNPIMEFP